MCNQPRLEISGGGSRLGTGASLAVLLSQLALDLADACGRGCQNLDGPPLDGNQLGFRADGTLDKDSHRLALHGLFYLQSEEDEAAGASSGMRCLSRGRGCEPVGRRDHGRPRASPLQGVCGRLPFRGQRQVAIRQRGTVDDAGPFAIDALRDSRRLEIARILLATLVCTGLSLAIGSRRGHIRAPGGDHGDTPLPRLGREAFAPFI